MPTRPDSRFDRILWLGQGISETRERNLLALLSEGSPEVVRLGDFADPPSLGSRYPPHRSLLWVSGIEHASSVPKAKAAGFGVIYDAPESECRSKLRRSLSALWEWSGVFRKARNDYLMERACASADAVVAASELDAAHVRRMAPRADVFVIPAWNDGDRSVDRDRPSRRDPGEALRILVPLDFTHPTDERSADWLCREILPRIRAIPFSERLEFILPVRGRPRSSSRDALRNAGVSLIEAGGGPAGVPVGSLVFLPLRGPARHTERVVVAMASGLPVVTTGRAAEGVSLRPGIDALLADRPDPLVSLLARLIRDPGLRAQIGEAARETVRRVYDWRASRETLAAILAGIRIR